MANTPLGPDKDKAFLTGSTAFTPQWRYLDVDGKLVLSVCVANGYWLIPTQENLRAFFAALSGGNNWDGDNNSTGYWAGRNFITSSYGGTLAAGDASFGNLILSSLNTGRKGLTTKENAINKWFVGQDADGKFKIQRRDGTNWVDVFVVDTSNNVFSAQSSIYSTDGGVTGTTISSNGVSNNTQGFVFSNATRIAEVTGNSIAITNKSNNFATSLRPDRIAITNDTNELSLSASPTTNNRSQTFQDKSGVIALLSDISGATTGVFLPLAGGTMSGDIQQPTAPVNGNSLITKGYVDTAISGKEDTANKKITLTNSATDYPSTSAVTAALSLNKALILTQADFAGDGINYTNTALANNNSYLLFLNGVRFLISGTDFTYKTTGGFTLIIPGYTIGANDQVVLFAQVGVSTLSNALNDRLRAWTNSTAYNLPSITRNSDGAITTASVVWPDLSTGTFTGTSSSVFAGAIDSFTITYVPATGTTLTITQPTLTRDSNGAVINQPALNIS